MRADSGRSIWWPPARSMVWPPFAALGPEPLGPALTVDHLKAALKGKHASRSSCCCSTSGSWPGSAISMSAKRCWRAGIRPTKPAGKVTGPQLARLVPAIVAVLEASIRDGGSTLRDYAAPSGELGYFASSFDVYGRDGQPCRRDDGGVIGRIAQGGRSTWFCPVCQK
jgi:formamidopyrimidine-DNA glycosylase